MSTTLTTQHSHAPWIASAAVVAVVAGAGLVGLALDAGDQTVQEPTLRTPTAQDYAQYQHYYPGGSPLAAPENQQPNTSGGHVVTVP